MLLRCPLVTFEVPVLAEQLQHFQDKLSERVEVKNRRSRKKKKKGKEELIIFRHAWKHKKSECHGVEKPTDLTNSVRKRRVTAPLLQSACVSPCSPLVIRRVFSRGFRPLENQRSQIYAVDLLECWTSQYEMGNNGLQHYCFSWIILRGCATSRKRL